MNQLDVYERDNWSTLYERFQEEVQSCGISLSSLYRKPSCGNVLSVNSKELVSLKVSDQGLGTLPARGTPRIRGIK